MSASPILRFLRLFRPLGSGYSSQDEQPKNKGFVISLCILTSCILWFAFSMQETYTQVLEFPTEIQNLPPDKALASLPPSIVRVQLEGEGIQILRLYYNTPSLPIDVSFSDLDLGLAAPEIIKNVSIQSVTPRQISVAIEDRIVRRVPIRSKISMQYESGYRLIGEVGFAPDSISISGARSIVENLSFWPTKPRNLGAMQDTLRATIALSDSLSGLLDLEFSEVTVLADIQPFTEGRRTLQVRATGLPPGVQVAFVPTSVEAIFSVPLSQYDAALEADDFYMFVPYDDINRDTQGMVFPMFHLPEGIEIQRPRFEPDRLRYYDVRKDG